MDKVPPPIDHTNDSTSVHLSYIRRDIDTINAKLDNLTNGYVTKADFEEHQKIDQDHEERIRTIEQELWKYIGFSSAISSAIALGGSFLIQHFIR